jgi:phage baseplate assembly protein W
MPRVPQFRTPFTVVDGAVLEVEQDSDRDVDQCIHAVLSTPVGSRELDAPEFGRPKKLFEQLDEVPSPDAYLAAVERWEPRARVRGEAVVEDLVERIVVEREAARV